MAGASRMEEKYEILIHKRILFIPLIYFLVGMVWIVFSDQVLIRLSFNSQHLTHLQTYKGSVFVVFTTVLLYLLVRHNFIRVLENEKQFRAALVELPFPIAIHSENGTVEFINKTWTELSGYTYEDIPTVDHWIQQAHGGHNPRVKAGVDRLYRLDHHVDEGTFQITTKSGKTRIWDFKSAPVGKDRHGHRLVISAAVDKTEQLVAEAAIQESEELHRIILDSISDAVFITDDDGNFTFVCPNAHVIFGYPYEEVMVKNNIQSLLGDVSELIQQTQSTPELKNIERTVVDKHHQVHFLLVNIKRVAIKNGTCLFTCRDITERLSAERAMHEQEERLRNTLIASQDGIWEHDLLQGRFECSERMLTMLGYDPAKCPSSLEFIQSLIHPDDIEHFEKEYRRFIESNDDFFTLEFRMKAYNGGWKQILSRGRCMQRDERHRACKIVGTHTDITRTRELEAQLLQSQKMESIGRLAGGIAHDFNNILMAIAGYTDFALQQTDLNNPAYDDLLQVKQSTERAINLTRQLLAFSRKQILKPEILDVNRLILNIDKMLRRMIGEDIEYVTIPARDLWKVKADPGQIEQVIVNLVVNARDAMAGGGKLTIETKNIVLDDDYAKHHAEAHPGQYVMIAVSDTGIGMTAEIKANLFEPFFTTKSRDKGTGLGLSTVHGIVKQSGGNIFVYSEVGRGSTFKIYLPRVVDEVEPAEIPDLPIQSYAGSETILLVEDDPMVRTVVERTLQDAGYKTLIASYASEAITLSERYDGSIHLLLTDVVMPRMSGKDLAEIICEKRSETRVLYMSGYTENTIVHHGMLDAGIQFIQKPFTTETLLKTIRLLLDRDLSL